VHVERGDVEGRAAVHIHGQNIARVAHHQRLSRRLGIALGGRVKGREATGQRGLRDKGQARAASGEAGLTTGT
jgi:hypothetical protein